MMKTALSALAVVLTDHKATLLARWEEAVSELPGAERLDRPTLRDHIPQFVDELIVAIARRDEEPVGQGGPGSPLEHGMQRLAAGFDIKEVVIEYHVLRDAVHEVAEAAGIPLSAAMCHAVNHVIDDAIAWAVDSYSREQAVELQRRREEHFAFIAHDVRTPLNAIALTASALAAELHPEDEESADMLRALLRNVRRIDDLIRRVMEDQKNLVSAEDLRLERREMDLWPLVSRLIEDMRPVTEAAGIRMANRVPRHVMVHADAGLLMRVLQNLVGNAVKFAANEEIEVGARERVNGIECWVTDTGAGIEPERLERIFEKLETDRDPEKAGFGLGLAICKQIVEAHGGAIAAESQPGRGATFRFTIPSRVPEQGA